MVCKLISIRKSLFFLIFIVIIFCKNDLKAQKDTTNHHPEIKTDSVERLNYVTNGRRNVFTLFVYGSRFSNGILYGGNRNLLYYPISPINVGLGFTHKWIGASFSLIAAEINKGKFEGNYNFNVQINAYSRKIGADLVYSINKGYYGANYKSFLDLNLNGTSKELPYYNVRMERLTVNVVRIFNGKKYSLNAPLVQGEIQKKSAGSFLLNTALSSAFTRNGDSLFVPSSLQPLFEGNTILKNGEFYSLSIMPGYGVTWVIREKFFVGIVPSIGPSFQFHHLTTQNSKEDYFTISYKILGRFGAGYHSERWTYGLSLLVDAENYPLKNNTHFFNNVGKIYFRIGYKFKVPRWAEKYSRLMDKYQEKVEQKLPLHWH